MYHYHWHCTNFESCTSLRYIVHVRVQLLLHVHCTELHCTNCVGKKKTLYELYNVHCTNWIQYNCNIIVQSFVHCMQINLYKYLYIVSQNWKHHRVKFHALLREQSHYIVLPTMACRAIDRLKLHSTINYTLRTCTICTNYTLYGV